MEKKDVNNKQQIPLNEEELNEVNGGFKHHKTMICPNCHLAIPWMGSVLESLNAHSSGCRGSVYVF